ncbi:MAG: agmatine deiminase family protein [Bacteroidota bacterium]
MIRTFLFSFLLINLVAFGQSPSFDDVHVPKYESFNPIFSMQTGSGIKTPPPFQGIRTSAEWEEIEYLTVTWTSFTSILREIVRHAGNETKVLIICSDSNTVKNYLIAGNVPIVNVKYLVAPYNSIWIRDYGQNTVYSDHVNNRFLVDWHYNRPSRPKDDTVPSRISKSLNVPLYETTLAPYDLISTGGNFMSDGMGTAFSSQLIDQENPSLTASQIDTIAKKFMGIDRYIRFPVLPYDGIHHIDMHMKLLDEQTLLVGQYPAGVSDGPQIEANLQYILSNFNSSFGTPYKVIRIPMPPDKFGLYPSANGSYTTYTNAVFVNKTIILPTYYQQYDTTALRIWKESMPGYNVIGIDCDNTSANIIAQSGAIHCITHSIGSSDPLLIVHQPLENNCDSINSFLISASIEHSSGISSAKVYWTNDTSQGFINSLPMTNASGNTWNTNLPPQSFGNSVYYYIEAVSNSGKVMHRPIVAPNGFWKFTVNCITTGINAITDKIEFKPIYPNPANSITCIPVSSDSEQKIKITLNNLYGQIVKNIFDGKITKGEKNFFIMATEFPPGTYYIQISSSVGVSTQKLIIID